MSEAALATPTDPGAPAAVDADAQPAQRLALAQIQEPAPEWCRTAGAGDFAAQPKLRLVCKLAIPPAR